MKKMKTLFKIDYSTRPHTITREVTKGSEWVMNGEGVATIKYDGTCCMVNSGNLYRRYTVKRNRRRPEGFIACDHLCCEGCR